VPEEDINAIHHKLATSLCSKLVKSLRKYMQQLPRHLEGRFTVAFEEENGVRRPWTSNLKEDAQRAREEVVLALSQLALVPSGFNVPGVADVDLQVAQVCTQC
jgi:hypothetical protein